MVDGVQSEVQLAAQLAGDTAASHAEQSKLEHAERLLDEQIAKVNSNPALSFEEKQRLVGQLNSARNGGAQAMTMAVQMVISETPAAAAATNFETLGNIAVSQEINVDAQERVNERSAYVDLDNARQRHHYAAAWVEDKGLPPALRENDIQHVDHYLQTDEGRHAVSILNEHPAETKKVLTQQEHAREQLETLEKQNDGNSPVGKAIHSALQHHLYAKADMPEQIDAATKNPEAAQKLVQGIQKNEADYQKFVHDKAPTAPTAAEAAITAQHPQAKLSNDQSLDRYAQMEHDQKRFDTATKAANDLLVHPEHTKNYSEEAIKDAVSWSTHHEDAVEFAIKETSQTVLDGVTKAKSLGKLNEHDVAISLYATGAGAKSIGVDARAQSLDQIAINGNSFLEQISKDKAGRAEIHHASEEVIKSGSLEAAFHTAGQTFFDGAKAMLTGDTKVADEKAHDVGLGVKNVAKKIMSDDAAQTLGHAATATLTTTGHGIMATVSATKTAAAATVDAAGAAVTGTQKTYGSMVDRASDLMVNMFTSDDKKAALAAITQPVAAHPVGNPAAAAHPAAAVVAAKTPTALEMAAHPDGHGTDKNTKETKEQSAAAAKHLNDMSALEAKLGLNVNTATLADVAHALSAKGITVDAKHMTADDLVKDAQSQNLPNVKPAPAKGAAAAAPAH